MEDFNTELSSVHDVKIAICYLLSKLNRPVTEEQLYEIALNSEVINYFFYTEAIAELLKNGSVSKKNINGENCIIIEEKGMLGSEYFNEFIPYHFRKRILRSAFAFFGKLKRESEADIEIKNISNGCEVECTIKDTNFDLMKISLYAPDSDQAEMIKEKILLNPTGSYHTILTYALNNEEEQFNADNV